MWSSSVGQFLVRQSISTFLYPKSPLLQNWCQYLASKCHNEFVYQSQSNKLHYLKKIRKIWKFNNTKTICLLGNVSPDHDNISFGQLVTPPPPFNGLFSRTTWVSRYQKGKTNLDFTGARDSEWQRHQLGHMQVCTSLQTDNHASTPPLSFLQAGCPSCRPTNSVKALKAFNL